MYKRTKNAYLLVTAELAVSESSFNEFLDVTMLFLILYCTKCA